MCRRNQVSGKVEEKRRSKFIVQRLPVLEQGQNTCLRNVCTVCTYPQL